MCIVSVAWQAHPRWPLIVIGNRDEFHERPAEPLTRWKDTDHILAGRDVQAGGTWLGVSEQGRLAVVTNQTGYGMPDPDRASRGDLLKHYLAGQGLYANLDSERYSEFNPFNLITIDGRQARICTNRPDVHSAPLDAGIHGLSNGPLHSPWPKSATLNQQLAAWVEGDADDPATLLDILADQTPYQPGKSSSRQSGPEPKYSPIFISNTVYGTRCSTVVAVDHKGAGTIIERRFAAQGKPFGETQLDFSWPV